VIESRDEKGGISMKFSKPIAVPTAAKKTEMVGLLLQNDMIELRLANADSGTSIKGEPYFDASEFKKKSVDSDLKNNRKLSEEHDVDPATARQLSNLIEKLKSMPKRRRL
jgi:hypothetical protein